MRLPGTCVGAASHGRLLLSRLNGSLSRRQQAKQIRFQYASLKKMQPHSGQRASCGWNGAARLMRGIYSPL